MWDGNSSYKGKIRIKCDNITSVKDSMKKPLKMGSHQSFRSLNRAIWKQILDLNKSGVKIEIKHIKIHQDDLQRFELNNKINKSIYHREGWSCWLGNNKCEDFKHN